MKYVTNAIRFTQNGRVFYTAAIPARVLVNIAEVDTWQQGVPDEDTGYQRAPSEARKRAIGRYVMEKDSIMPVGGLLNSRPKIAEGNQAYGTMMSFEKTSGDSSIDFGELTIPESAQPLYIVDMQHRLGGFEWAMEQPGYETLGDFPLVVTIADGLTKLEEIDQFDLINTTQKKVRTDLARRLKAIQAKDLDHREQLEISGKLWEAKGANVVDLLNSTEGVWYQRILPPNRSKAEMPTAIARETSFVESLKSILTQPYFTMQSDEHCAELIARYWEAIRRVFPEAFENPEEYVIQKSPGIFALNSIATYVFEMARHKGGVTVDAIYEVVKPLGEIDEDSGSVFWRGDNEDGAAQYGSQKGFKILMLKLRKLLPSLRLE